MALEKRRAKSKCHLCGRLGHIRRECPGVDDGGRGASKYSKAKGDSGATSLKSSSHSKKGAKNRGRKESKNLLREGQFPPLPPGFEADSVASDEDNCDPFLYYDASCNIMATVEYLRFGRGKNKLSTNEAVALYESAIQTAIDTSNYGGCISRSPPLKPGRPWCQPSSLSSDDYRYTNTWFVVGLGRDFLYNDSETESAVSTLLQTLAENTSVVGFYADLDYSPVVTSQPGCDTLSQLQRLECTCQAAAEAGVTIQIRLSPSVSSVNGEQEDSLYEAVMSDLKQILVQSIVKHPHLKVHLSCWSGGADDMNSLIQEFPENVWIGFDATVTFAKASHIHECAFDIPLSRLVLETGDTTIPSVVAKTMGRSAFSYSGLIPFVAESVAGMKRNGDITAETVARAASSNTQTLYPQILLASGVTAKDDNDDTMEKEETPAS